MPDRDIDPVLFGILEAREELSADPEIEPFDDKAVLSAADSGTLPTPVVAFVLKC